MNHILYVSNLIFTQESENRHEKSVKCFRKPVILENLQMFQKMKVTTNDNISYVSNRLASCI